MPLTKSGKKVMGSMKRKYGEDKGEEVFYASINKGSPGSGKWHGKGKKWDGASHNKGGYKVRRGNK